MGHNLKKLRLSRGWTQAEAGAALGYSTSGYKKIERSERSLRHDVLERAAKVYDVPPSALFNAGGVPESLTPELLAAFALVDGPLNEAERRALEAQLDLIAQARSARNGDNQDNGSPQ